MTIKKLQQQMPLRLTDYKASPKQLLPLLNNKFELVETFAKKLQRWSLRFQHRRNKVKSLKTGAINYSKDVGVLLKKQSSYE